MCWRYPEAQDEEVLCSMQVGASSSAALLQLTPSHTLCLQWNAAALPPCSWCCNSPVATGLQWGPHCALCIREYHGAWASLVPLVGEEKHPQHRCYDTRTLWTSGKGSSNSGTHLANKKLLTVLPCGCGRFKPCLHVNKITNLGPCPKSGVGDCCTHQLQTSLPRCPQLSHFWSIDLCLLLKLLVLSFIFVFFVSVKPVTTSHSVHLMPHVEICLLPSDSVSISDPFFFTSQCLKPPCVSVTSSISWLF